MGFDFNEENEINAEAKMHETMENADFKMQMESEHSDHKMQPEAVSADFETQPAATSESIPSDRIKAGRFSNFGEGENSLSVERIKNSTLGFKRGEDAPKEVLFEELKRRIRSYHPSGDLSLIEKAYRVADEAHRPKIRKSGQPYITHPLHVALILADLRMDKETLASGLLHDVIEDCPGYDYNYIFREFGKEIADIVDGVTKSQKDGVAGEVLSNLRTKHKGEERLRQHAETYRKMLLSSGKNPRVLYVKLADRLHNMRTLEHMSEEKQKAIALETINIYSALAEKLGISKIKVELDDYSLKYLHPDMYKSIKDRVNQRLEERLEYINQIIDRIKEILKENEIEASVTGRVKHFYSIYKKISKKKKHFDEIYDLFAVRVITKDISDAYKADGVISQEYTSVPARRKDYIAKEKPNGYRSIHETMYGPDKNFFELQVRTEEMHREASYGKAAHWVYKERGDGAVATEDEIRKKIWLEQLTEAVMEEDDNEAFLERTKEILDIDQDKVVFYAATNMQPWELPVGSTVVDFAYSIHSDLGNRMIGAKVFNRLVAFHYVIKSFDVVEIMSAKGDGWASPKRNWLNFVHLNSTKSKIKAWFNKQNKEENIKKGQELLIKQCNDDGTDPSILEVRAFREKAMDKLYCDSWEKVLANIGLESIKAGKVLNWMKDAKKSSEPVVYETSEEVMERINSQKQDDAVHPPKGAKSVFIEGIDLKSIRFPKCCSPIPGDLVIGYISKIRGMSIHRENCVNTQALVEGGEERIKHFVLPDEIEYYKPFRVTVLVRMENKLGIAADVMRMVADLKMSASNLHADNDKTNRKSWMVFDVGVRTKSELNKLLSKIQGVRGVYSAERAQE